MKEYTTHWSGKFIKTLLKENNSELTVHDVKKSLQLLSDFCISCSAQELIDNCPNEQELRIYRTSLIKKSLNDK